MPLIPKRWDADLDRVPDPFASSRMRRRVAAGLGLTAGALLTLTVLESRLPDGPPAVAVRCQAEDELLLVVDGDQFDYADGQVVCVHLDYLVEPVDG